MPSVLKYTPMCFLLMILPSLTSSAIIYSNTQCTSNTLEPCKTHPVFSESVYCNNISDFNTFVRVLRCASKKNMQEVYLERSSLDFLPLYALDFCGFFILNVKSVILSKLLEGNALVRLQNLHLDDVLFTDSWSWEPLSVLKQLQKFSVENMIMPVLNGTLVDHLNTRLRSFTLKSTNTTEIASNALTKFADLEYVSIQNNEVAEVTRSMFPTPAVIKYFYFRKNKISSLPEDIFSDMPNLQHIALQGNLLSEIHDNTFRGVWNNLHSLLLEDNPLKCRCKMLWLAKKHSPEVFTGSCYAPKLKYGKPLKYLTALDFRCFTRR